VSPEYGETEEAKQRKQYSEEFNRDTVRMMRNRGERTVVQVADDLGVNANQLHCWPAKTAAEAVAKRKRQGRNA
jgi:transposase-like protein